MLKDPEGAYCQLIRLQEVTKEAEKGRNDQEKQDITVDSGRHSSQRFSFLRSVSRTSSGIGNSSRHSFSVSFGVPTGIDLPTIENTNSTEPSKSPAQVSLRRLVYLNKPEIPILLLGVVAAVANGLVLPIFGILISSIIKTFFEPKHQLRKDSEFWALMFVVLGLASCIATPSRAFFFSMAGCRLIKRIRSLSFEKVVHMEVSWFDEAEHSSGAIGARLAADAASIRTIVGDALALVVQNAATVIAGLVIAFVANWQLALIILLLVPLVGVNGYTQARFIRGFSADAKVCSTLSKIKNLFFRYYIFLNIPSNISTTSIKRYRNFNLLCIRFR